MINRRMILILFAFLTCIMLSTSCNRGIINNSDIGMPMQEFFEQIGEYAVLEMGTDSGVFSFGEGRKMRVAHFKNGKLIKIEKK